MNYRCKTCEADFGDYEERKECPYCEVGELELYHPQLRISPDLTKEVIAMGMINRGFKYGRVEHNEREKAFADTWEKENEPRAGLNFGQGTLQDLFFDKVKTENIFSDNTVCKIIIDDTTRYIVATVVQWFGSNCGMAFLHEALRKCGYRLEYVKDDSPQST